MNVPIETLKPSPSRNTKTECLLFSLPSTLSHSLFTVNESKKHRNENTFEPTSFISSRSFFLFSFLRYIISRVLFFSQRSRDENKSLFRCLTRKEKCIAKNVWKNGFQSLFLLEMSHKLRLYDFFGLTKPRLGLED